jgi:hypothetical protein
MGKDKDKRNRDDNDDDYDPNKDENMSHHSSDNEDDKHFSSSSSSDEEDFPPKNQIIPFKTVKPWPITKIRLQKKQKVEPKPIKHIPVDTTIETLGDLIKLGENYDPKFEYNCVINLKILNDLVAPLKELNNLIGLSSFKDALINQLIFQLSGLGSSDKSERMLHTVLLGRPGTGKCLAHGTPVRMYNGSIKPVQDIKVDELIMGDDSTARKILSITTGQEQMYRIDQGYGDSYTVNESHILSLKLSKNPRIKERSTQQSYQVQWFSVENYSSKTFSWRESSKEIAYQAAKIFTETLPKKGSVIDICIKDYLKKPTSWKTGFKGYKVGIDYPKKQVTLNPYLLGAWLGDGTSSKTQITGIDTFKEEYPELYDMTTSNGGYPGRNPFLNQLKKYNLINNKHIPSDYLINDRETRLQLLAGLIDTDGHYTSGIYEIIQKRLVLADNIRELARSLGFRATTTKCEKSCMYKGEKRIGTYYRTFISGNLESVPTKLKRKQARIRKQIKDPLVYGITVTPTKIDNYYGFEIDGNRRFILGDFTVTHNTTSARILGKIYTKMGYLTKGQFIIAKRADLIGKYLGHTAIKTLKVLESARGGVLFIDEVYSLGNARQDDGDSFSKECIDTINQFLSEHANDFICIIAGYKEEVEKCFFSHNPGLERRFPYRFTIEGYSPAELFQIFLKFVKDNGWAFESENTITAAFFQENKESFPHFGGDLGIFLDNCKIAHARRTFILPPENWKKLSHADIQIGFGLYKKSREMQLNVLPPSVQHLYL